VGSKDFGPKGSGKAVGYDRGPTRRVEPPSSSVTKGSSGQSTGSKGAPASGLAPTRGQDVKQKDWSHTKGAAPKGTKTSSGGVLVKGSKTTGGTKGALGASKLPGRTTIGKGAAAGSIGGVYPSDYRGGLDLDDDWVCDPYGWDDDNCGYYGYYGSYWGSWCWWSYPLYWSWYYPCWWWYSRPYYYYDYAYYPSAPTVVYAEPQVIYVDSGSSAYAGEPVGEAVAPAATGRVAPPPAAEPSPLSIAAQRYLELGDRAFREGRYTDSVQFYAKAVEFAPDQGALYLVLSDALFAAGDYHYGAYAVRRALELDPALVDSQIDKHAFYPDPRQFDEQLAALERYLGEHPSDRDARLMLGLNFLFGARPQDAVRVLESHAASMVDDHAAQKVLARARQLAQG
jgi:hypothetical protein